MKNINFKKSIFICFFLFITILAFFVIFLFIFKKDLYSYAYLTWQDDQSYLIVSQKQHQQLKQRDNQKIEVSYLKQNYEAQYQYLKKVDQSYIYAFLADIPYDDETNIIIHFKNQPLIYFLIFGGYL